MNQYDTCIISDLHFGARNNHTRFLEQACKFFAGRLIPFLKNNPNIKKLYILGDIFDSRKTVDYKVLDAVQKFVFEPLEKWGKPITIVAGNHDTYYRSTNRVNSLETILEDYENFHLIAHEAQEVDGFLFVPWINRQNSDGIMEAIKETECPVCFGHFEISGGSVMAHRKFEAGLPVSTFSHFTQVFSGHFHHRHTLGNILYVGTPYQLTWNDYGQARGFHLFDSESLEYKFMPFKSSMFYKIIYNDTTDIDYESDLDTYQHKYVRLIVEDKTDVVRFDKLVSALNSLPVLNLNVIDNIELLKKDTPESENGIDLSKNTLAILDDYVDTLELNTLEPKRMKEMIRTIYADAQTLEDLS